jgi:hypothetical protein
MGIELGWVGWVLIAAIIVWAVDAILTKKSAMVYKQITASSSSFDEIRFDLRKGGVGITNAELTFCLWKLQRENKIHARKLPSGLVYFR